jgi:serine/threonine protein kinase
MSDARPGGRQQGRRVADRYQLLEPIGRGGMGIVWRAHDELLDREVAVKEVRYPGDPQDDEVAELNRRTLREARAAGRLTHPNVVVVHDVIEENGRPWIVMQLVDSRSLGQVLRDDGPLPVRMAAEIGLQVLEALRTAHAAGVLHRDVKPENVLLTEDGRVVLTDFGIARMETDTTMTRTGLVGTPAFIAPERLRGYPAQRESDLWSLGATLYAAVEGRPPHDKGMAMATMHAVLNDEPEPALRAGRLGAVLSGLLEKNPAERLTADQAERMLRSIAEDRSAVPAARQPTLPATPLPPPATSPPGKQPRAGQGPAARRDPAPPPAPEPAAQAAPGPDAAEQVSPPDDPVQPTTSSKSSKSGKSGKSGTPVEAATPGASVSSGAAGTAGAPATSGSPGASGTTGTPGADGEQAGPDRPTRVPRPSRGTDGETRSEARKRPYGAGSRPYAAGPGVDAGAGVGASPDSPSSGLGESEAAGPDRPGPAPSRPGEAAGEASPAAGQGTSAAAQGATAGGQAPTMAAEASSAAGQGTIAAGRGTTVAGQGTAFADSGMIPMRPEGEEPGARGDRPLPIRRIVLLAIPAILVVGGIALWLGAQNAADTGRPNVAGSSGKASPRGEASGGASHAGTVPSTAASDPASSASASASPGESATPTPSPTPTTSGPADIPAGWHKYKDSTGFSIALPKGWKRAEQRYGTQVFFRGPDSHSYLMIDQTDSPHANAKKNWDDAVPGMSRNFGGYKLIAIKKVDYWKTAADWEFTFGNGQSHAIDRGFVTGKHHGYAIFWKTASKDWKKKLDMFHTFTATFQPAK